MKKYFKFCKVDITKMSTFAKSKDYVLFSFIL